MLRKPELSAEAIWFVNRLSTFLLSIPERERNSLALGSSNFFFIPQAREILIKKNLSKCTIFLTLPLHSVILKFSPLASLLKACLKSLRCCPAYQRVICVRASNYKSGQCKSQVLYSTLLISVVFDRQVSLFLSFSFGLTPSCPLNIPSPLLANTSAETSLPVNTSTLGFDLKLE